MKSTIVATWALCLLIAAAPWSAIAAELPQEKEFTNTLGMKVVRIEPGEFLMGIGQRPPRSKEEWLTRDEDESPAHQVEFRKPFYLGVYEVTNAQFEQFAPQHAKLRGFRGASERDEEPAVHVTWQEAVDFCAWLSAKEQLPYRLPTEAEWEYACRAGTTTLFNTGDTLGHDQANLGLDKEGKNQIRARAVGSYKPNAWCLYDMHGNVAEWCSDWHGRYEGGNQIEPVGRAAGHARVVRGWSWLSAGFQKTARFARSANRSGLLPEDANRFTGFRVVLGDMSTTKPRPPATLPLFQQDVKQTPAEPVQRDGDEPYFVDYDVDDHNPTIPEETWGPIFSQHNHYSTVCVCPNGDVLAVWYTCVGEGDRQLAQAASRLRAGSDKWDPASLFFGTPDVNTHAPVLLRDGNRIYHFCTQSLQGWDEATDIVRTSDDSGATWSTPRVMVSRDAELPLSQPCSAIVASDGAIVVACDGDSHRDERVVVSRDQGETWTVAKGDMRESAGDRYVIHPAIFQRKDGAILSFLRGPNPMPVLISEDFGETYEAHDSPFEGIGVGQKAAVLRLASGAILMLTHDGKRKLVGGGPMVALSLDEGHTWPHARKVEAPIGGYMALAQDAGGTIYMTGAKLRFAACNEAWIREGKPLSE